MARNKTVNLPALHTAVQELAPELLKGSIRGLSWSEAFGMPQRIKTAFAPIHELNNDNHSGTSMRWLQSVLWEANSLQCLSGGEFFNRLQALCQSAFNLTQSTQALTDLISSHSEA